MNMTWKDMKQYEKMIWTNCKDRYGCFQRWGYPQIIHFNRVFHYKPSILGYHYFRKHPYNIFFLKKNTTFSLSKILPGEGQRSAVREAAACVLLGDLGNTWKFWLKGTSCCVFVLGCVFFLLGSKPVFFNFNCFFEHFFLLLGSNQMSFFPFFWTWFKQKIGLIQCHCLLQRWGY